MANYLLALVIFFCVCWMNPATTQEIKLEDLEFQFSEMSDEKKEKLENTLLAKMQQRKDALREAVKEIGANQEQPTIGKVLSFTDRRYPSLSWSTFRTSGGRDAVRHTGTERELVIRLIRASEAEQKDLDLLFQERLKQNQKSRETIDSFLATEKGLRNYSLGIPVDAGVMQEMQNIPIPSQKEINLAFKKYIQAEDKNERELIRKMQEIIDPIQFTVLYRRWGRTLDMPMCYEVLDLTDQQIADIERDCLKYERRKAELLSLKSPTGSKISPADAIARLKSDRERLRLRYIAYSRLTPQQFMTASALLSEWRNCKSFKMRLEQLAETDGVPAETRFTREVELEVLGDLYREGAEWESAKASK